jgi:hypothetical protein
MPNNRKGPYDWRKPENHKIWWRITVGGYGEFAFFGDQFEAEERRKAKAVWESAPAFKEPIPEDHPLVLREKAEGQEAPKAEVKK